MEMQMENGNGEMENAGYLPEVTLAPLLTKASSATPAVAQEEEWKNEGETGRRADGFAAGT